MLCRTVASAPMRNSLCQSGVSAGTPFGNRNVSLVSPREGSRGSKLLLWGTLGCAR